jgi:hypothetical protein
MKISAANRKGKTALHAANAPRGSVWKLLFIVSTAWILLYIDPLAIEEATAARADAITMRIEAALYPAPQSDKARVTVVLIDQESLDKEHLTWPLAYKLQGRLLRQIKQFEPQAIFVDFLYKNPHQSSLLQQDKPAELLETLYAGNDPGKAVPIYLSGLTLPPCDSDAAYGDPCIDPDRNYQSLEDVFDHSSVLPDILNWPGAKTPTSDLPQSRIALVNWSGYGEQYPLYLFKDPAALTPALALYLECKDCASRRDVKEPRKSFQQPMTVIWGAFPPREESAFYGCQRSASENGLLRFGQRAGWILTELMSATLGGKEPAIGSDDALPCPAFTMIPASEFWEEDRQRQDPGKPDQISPLKALVNGRFVLVGARVQGFGDVIMSPVHGQLPGVTFHAMALDNLLNRGDRYVREWEGGRTAFMVVDLLVLLAVAFATYFWGHIWLRHHLWRRVSLGCCIALAIFALSKVDFRSAHPDQDMLREAAIVIGLGGLLSLISPAVLPRALTAFLFMCFTAVAAMEAGYAPGNWLIPAVAAVLVGEKVFMDLHPEAETEYARARWHTLLSKGRSALDGARRRLNPH